MKRILCVVLALGCAHRLNRQIVVPTGASTLDHRSRYLKAHMKDGRVFVLAAWSVDESARVVHGSGEELGVDRHVKTAGIFDLPMGDVALFETNVVEPSGGVAGLAIVTAITGGLAIFCLSHTKSCFGSCPTFYVDDQLAAEGFSDAIAPSLEATDLDALWRAHPSGRELVVRMTNEAMETHVVKRVRLLAAPRPPDGRVIATPSGELLQARALASPVVCRAAEGDCTTAVLAFDGRERFTTTDEHDLATRETIDLEFAPARGSTGIIIGARQTFVTTYLFYQLLAYLGHQAGDAIAALERNPGLRAQVFGLGRAIGGIEVLVEDGQGGWRVAGQVQETGPLAADVKVVPIPDASGGWGASAPRVGNRRVRLRMARGHWRLDYVALAELGPRVEARELELSSGPRRTLVTQPGDEHRFVFQLPEHPERWELFLESRGYYLEWMRSEWLPEENPVRAAMMLGAPDVALRMLAPEFKRLEPHMEELFWRSRIAPHPR